MATYKSIKNKICSSCQLEKQVEEFSKRKISKDGFRNSCKSCEREKARVYIENNKEKISLYNKEWKLTNLDKVKNNMDNFLKNNPDYKRNYTKMNRSKINDRNHKRREDDVLFRLKENIRTLIKNSLKYNGVKKNQKSVEILGCTHYDFKTHIESLWEPWMNWDNYGNPKDGVLQIDKTWDIDHIIPLSSAKSEEELVKLNHFSNLRPLCSYTNRIIKRNKTI